MTPEARPELRTLIAKWREDAQAGRESLMFTPMERYCTAFATVLRLERCADELEASLSLDQQQERTKDEEQAWRPMSSAPEATYVMVWLPNYGAFRAIGSRATHAPTVMEWWAPQADGGSGAMVYPSHWRPLPDPPRSAAFAGSR